MERERGNRYKGGQYKGREREREKLCAGGNSDEEFEG